MKMNKVKIVSYLLFAVLGYGYSFDFVNCWHEEDGCEEECCNNDKFLKDKK